MSIKILMPALSPTMKEGKLLNWLKKEGDTIKSGDVIAEIETDKASMDLEAADEGVLGKILVPDNTEKVKVGDTLAWILEDGEKVESLPASSEAKETPQTKTDNLDSKDADSNSTNEDPKSQQEFSPKAKSKPLNSERIFASPLAKKIAEEQQIDLSKVTGTGPSSRIVKKDVLNIANTSSNEQASSSQDSVVIPHTNMRKTIASRLVEAKNTIPHFYLNLQCKVDALLKARAQINEKYSSENVKISVNDLVIKATAQAIKDVPEVNASWESEGVRVYKNIDISVAVSVEGGLFTPIIRNADKKSILEISAEMKQLIQKAKSGKLKPSEFQGGGFGISNLGMYGIKEFNAIINPPQSCMLAIGATEKLPSVLDDKIVVSSLMNISLSCDHRVIDGVLGARFLASLKQIMESPVLIFM